MKFVLFFTIFSTLVQATNWNLPYPRTFCQNWGTGTAEIFTNLDMVVMAPNQGLAQKVRLLKPDIILLPTRDWNVGGAVDTLHDVWKLKYASGKVVIPYPNAPENILANHTDLSPLYFGKRYNQAGPDHLAMTDFLTWDGVATDGCWADNIYAANPDSVDFNVNGVAEKAEHPENPNFVNDEWRKGWISFFKNLRSQMPADKVITVNNGGTFFNGDSILNGMMIECLPIFSDAENTLACFDTWYKKPPTPKVFYIDVNLEGDCSGVGLMPTNYQAVRYGVATALMGGAYIGVTEVFHYYFHFYDEFAAELGFKKVSDKHYYALDQNFKVAFFDSGMAILHESSTSHLIRDSELRFLPWYDGPYYFFQGNQDPQRNNGSRFDSLLMSGGGLYGDGVVLLKRPQVVMTDIVVDNSAQSTTPGSTPAGFRTTADWLNGDNTSGGDYYCNRYNNSTYTGIQYAYRYINPGDGSKWARFKPTLNVAGNYEVWEWHGYHGSTAQMASNIPYEIVNGLGDTLRGTLNQQSNSGKWNYLATVNFASGQKGEVYFFNNANGVIMADAVKFIEKIPDPVAIESAVSALNIKPLLSCFPNPVHSQMRISYSVIRSEPLQIKLLDLAGRTRAILFDARGESGEQIFYWDAKHVPAGIYILQLTGQTQKQIIPIIILK